MNTLAHKIKILMNLQGLYQLMYNSYLTFRQELRLFLLTLSVHLFQAGHLYQGAEVILGMK
jgi:hypothetical protein